MDPYPWMLSLKLLDPLDQMPDPLRFGAADVNVPAGLYAQTMAERGFLTLAFDPSFTGESGGAGLPRHQHRGFPGGGGLPLSTG